MDNSDANYGHQIQAQRKRLNMTQQQLADSICSQSMLSGIEKGIYIPNIMLFAQLCARLGLSVEHALLHDYPTINHSTEFNQTIKQLCNAHHYAEMINYLAKAQVINYLITDQDFQTYYYYMGIAIYQAKHDYQNAKQNLVLALSYTPTDQIKTALENLIAATIAFIDFKHSDRNVASVEFQACLDRIKQNKILFKNENLNSIYYQYAVRLYQKNNFATALAIVDTGIQHITDIDSHFMLADLFLLKSAIHIKLNQLKDAQIAGAKAASLSEIFSLELYPLT